MNKVKYQIFISSTFEDLKEERDQVIKACLEMGHIPVGMEMFSAADEEQWKIITRQIDESDYYVIIVANRYGSMVGGISYTEKEYDYAVTKGVPILGFMLDRKAPWPSDRIEDGKKGASKLEAFKKKVKLKPVDFWSTKEELHGKCAVALSKTFNTQPRPGWVRTPEVTGAETTAELTRLSSENNKLRLELAELHRKTDTSGFSQGEDLFEFKFRVDYIGVRLDLDFKTKWNDIFSIVARNILVNPKETFIKGKLEEYYQNEVLTIAFSKNQFGIKTFELYKKLVIHYLHQEEFDIIKTQFLALGLIDINHINQENSWSLTIEGQRQYAAQAAKRRTD